MWTFLDVTPLCHLHCVSTFIFNINLLLTLTFGKCASRTLAQSKLSACFTATTRTSLVSFLPLRLRDLMSSLIVADVFCRLSYFGFEAWVQLHVFNAISFVLFAIFLLAVLPLQDIAN